jgi:hypothetical protein
MWKGSWYGGGAGNFVLCSLSMKIQYEQYPCFIVSQECHPFLYVMDLLASLSVVDTYAAHILIHRNYIFPPPWLVWRLVFPSIHCISCHNWLTFSLPMTTWAAFSPTILGALLDQGSQIYLKKSRSLDIIWVLFDYWTMHLKLYGRNQMTILLWVLKGLRATCVKMAWIYPVECDNSFPPPLIVSGWYGLWSILSWMGLEPNKMFTRQLHCENNCIVKITCFSYNRFKKWPL